MSKIGNKKILLIAEILAIACILCVTVFTSAFYALDAMLCDKLYTDMEGVSRDIRIIAIDEETLDEYGSFSTWSREKCRTDRNSVCR